MTPQMKAALDFIRAYIAQNGGVSPSYENIMAALDLSSKSLVSRLVGRLEERGYISVGKHRSRSIRLINEPPRASQIAAWPTDELVRVASTIGEVLAKRRTQAIFQGGDA